jgi:hypothetical protein
MYAVPLDVKKSDGLHICGAQTDRHVWSNARLPMSRPSSRTRYDWALAVRRRLLFDSKFRIQGAGADKKTV